MEGCPLCIELAPHDIVQYNNCGLSTKPTYFACILLRAFHVLEIGVASKFGIFTQLQVKPPYAVYSFKSCYELGIHIGCNRMHFHVQMMCHTYAINFQYQGT